MVMPSPPPHAESPPPLAKIQSKPHRLPLGEIIVVLDQGVAESKPQPHRLPLGEITQGVAESKPQTHRLPLGEIAESKSPPPRLPLGERSLRTASSQPQLASSKTPRPVAPAAESTRLGPC